MRRKATFRKGARRHGWRRVLAAIIALPLVAAVASVVALRWIDPPGSAFMLGYVLTRVEGDPALHTRWVDYEAIVPAMKIAVIASEDQRFKDHHGFDVREIAQAWAEARDGGRSRGASTISQQVARNLFLWPASSWPRKALEAYFTVLIEAAWSKRRILEVYLNVAEFGRGVYGVEAAAERYFGKSAARLGRAEAARLAAVLPSPRRFSAGAPSRYVLARQAWILAQMHRLDAGRYLRALE
jgi:monofunctional biosynthetic peptidoglycan transglycosylase